MNKTEIVAREFASTKIKNKNTQPGNDIFFAAKEGFEKGAEWQSKKSPWISVEDRLPEENENIIIMCEHGAIFNGTYCNGVWLCMDGCIHDTYKGNPIYSSMCSIPPLWKPTHWMPIPALPPRGEE